MAINLDDFKLTEQLLILAKNRITGVPVDNHTPYFRTNNWVQRTISILLAYNSSKEEFQLLGVDDNNRIKVTGEIGSTDGASTGTLKFLRVDANGRLLISTEENLKESVELFDNIVIAASQTATHAGLDVSAHRKKTFYFKTTANTTINFQFSYDGNNWFDWVDAAGNPITITVNNTSKAFAVDDHTRFIRVFVENDSAAENTVNIDYEGAA